MRKNIAIVVNAKEFNTVMQNHLNEILNDSDIKIEYLLIDSFNEIKNNLNFFKKVLFLVIKSVNFFFKILDILKKRKKYEFDKRLSIYKYIKSNNLSKISDSLDVVKLTKFRYDFAESQLVKIKKSCDAIILLGVGRIFDGKILECTKKGVLSFHPADIRKYRGRPSGLHEWINCEKYLGITVQRLSQKIDGGEIITERSVSLKNNRSLVSAMEEMRIVRKGMISEAVHKVFLEDQKFEKPDFIKHNRESDFYIKNNVFKYVKRHIFKC
jgi:folate-dependent phosphoribosylglycinamide formyltransferase PurN